MDNQYINALPIPACTVGPDGLVSAANPLIKNVFVYEDITGYNFFTLTGIKREQLMNANHEEMILERNDKMFKLWINEGAEIDKEMRITEGSSRRRSTCSYVNGETPLSHL